MNRILILEDEGVLRASMARGIGKLPGVEVVDAGTFAEALRFIDERPPKLILSDLDLPDRSGLELLGALGARGLRIPIIFITAYLKAYGSQIPPHANVEVREKPIALEELRKLVRTYLEDTTGSPFSVTDYLQIAAMGSHSVEISLERDDARSGKITVFSGTLWSAYDEQGSGPEAFKRLALMPNAYISCSAIRREPGERNIYDSLEHLLLEAAQHQDEALRDADLESELSFSDISFDLPVAQESTPAPPAPAPSAPPIAAPVPRAPAATPTPPAPAQAAAPAPAPAPAQPAPAAPPAPKAAPAEDFDTLWQRGSEALLDKKYSEALEYFRKAQAINPNDARVIKYIDRLTKKQA